MSYSFSFPVNLVASNIPKNPIWKRVPSSKNASNRSEPLTFARDRF